MPFIAVVIRKSAFEKQQLFDILKGIEYLKTLEYQNNKLYLP